MTTQSQEAAQGRGGALMGDAEKRIRDALANNPLGGEWLADELTCYTLTEDGWNKGARAYKNKAWFRLYADREVSQPEAVATTEHFAACNPDAIRALLAELDAARTDRDNLRSVLIEVLDKVPLTDSGPFGVPTAAKARRVMAATAQQQAIAAQEASGG